MDSKVVTIGRHIIDQEKTFPGVSGQFSTLLYDLALACKIISRAVNKAGLVDILGGTGATNVQGEGVQRLDAFAQDVIVKAMDHGGHLCAMVSEEARDPIQIPSKFRRGKYVLAFDPLDGSSNIDVNAPIGTIFAVHRKLDPTSSDWSLKDCLQAGRRMIAAGYVVYGASTMLVYATQAGGVHGFTLDPSIGEFVLSHPQIRIPEPPERIYSVNEAYYDRWSAGQRAIVDEFRRAGRSGGAPWKSRYIGSLIADAHRTLLTGGLFMYPADRTAPSGKLRLLYEAAPLAMIFQAAGGAASDGKTNIVDIPPSRLHQRTPVYLGSSSLVRFAREQLAEN